MAIDKSKIIAISVFIISFPAEKNLWVLRATKAATLALMMSLIVHWFLLEFGLISAIFVFLGVLLTPWFTYLGRDLWFCVWTNFLPFIILIFFGDMVNSVVPIIGIKIN